MQNWKSEPCGAKRAAPVCPQPGGSRSIPQGRRGKGRRDGKGRPPSAAAWEGALPHQCPHLGQGKGVCCWTQRLHYMPVSFFRGWLLTGSQQADPAAEAACEPPADSAGMYLLCHRPAQACVTGLLYFLACLIWLCTHWFTLTLSLSLSLSKYMPVHTLYPISICRPKYTHLCSVLVVLLAHFPGLKDYMIKMPIHTWIFMQSFGNYLLEVWWAGFDFLLAKSGVTNLNLLSRDLGN